MKTELYSIIKSPYLTEKVSSLMGESNQMHLKLILMLLSFRLKKQLRVTSLLMLKT